MPEPITISTFRKKAGPYFTEVIHHHSPMAISRGGGDLGVLFGAEEVWALVSDRSFSPEVMRSDGGVSIWLPEFGIYGQGSSYAEAKQDLLDEVRIYVAEYLENSQEYVRAPNRAGHLPYVIKAYLADLRGELERLIFTGPPARPPVAHTPVVQTPVVVRS